MICILVLHRNRSLAKVSLVEPNVYQHRLASPRQCASAHQRGRYLRHILDKNSLGTEAFHNVVVSRAREHRGDIIVQHLYLFASNLGPTGIVADDCDHRDTMPHERIEFGKAITTGAIAKDDPHLAVGAANGGTKRKPRANTQRTKHARIDLGERRARKHHVRRGRHEIAAIGHQYCVVARFALEHAKKREWVSVAGEGHGLLVDLGFANRVARTQLRYPR